MFLIGAIGAECERRGALAIDAACIDFAFLEIIGGLYNVVYDIIVQRPYAHEVLLHGQCPRVRGQVQLKSFVQISGELEFFFVFFDFRGTLRRASSRPHHYPINISPKIYLTNLLYSSD